MAAATTPSVGTATACSPLNVTGALVSVVGTAATPASTISTLTNVGFRPRHATSRTDGQRRRSRRWMPSTTSRKS